MLVLLPPSESKASSPRRGAALALETLSFAPLTQTRERVIDALMATSARPDALSRLGLTPGLADELTRNLVITSAPTVRVSALYSGVLYEALAIAELDAGARRRAYRSVVVMSALYGAVRLTDRLAPYRLSGNVTLPGLGGVASLWRRDLDSVLPDAIGRGLCLDLRSSTYAAMWRPTGAVVGRTTHVRVLHERRPGDPSSRQVVSHFNKATKGRLLRALLESGADPRTLTSLADALSDLGYPTEVSSAGTSGRAAVLDVVVQEL